MANTPITKASGEIVRAEERVNTIEAMLRDDRVRRALAEALPQGLDTTRFARIAATSLRRNARLRQCSPGSFLSALLQAAQLGLEIDSGLGHAYLVPYKAECTLILGYRGLVDLARRSGQVSTVQAHVVRQGDDFYYSFGLEPRLHHEPTSPIESKVTHAYAVVKLRDGNTQFDVMARDQIDAIRRRSRAGTEGPWVTDFDEMAKKTVLRRLAKLLPMSAEAHRAVTLDEHADAGLSQAFEVELDELPEPAAGSPDSQPSHAALPSESPAAASEGTPAPSKAPQGSPGPSAMTGAQFLDLCLAEHKTPADVAKVLGEPASLWVKTAGRSYDGAWGLCSKAWSLHPPADGRGV